VALSMWEGSEDAAGQGWIGRAGGGGEGVADKGMIGVAGHGVFHLRAGVKTADLEERNGDALGIAGELHRRGVGEKFALPGDRSLDQTGEKTTDVADQEESETRREHDEGESRPLLAVGADAPAK